MNNINGIINSVYIEAENLIHNIGETVLIHGVVYKIRRLNGFAFVLLQTKRIQVQCIWAPEYSDFKIDDLVCNMNVLFTARVVSEERSSAGYELQLINFRQLSVPDPDLPVVINNKEFAASLDMILDYKPITLRNQRERTIFKIQEGIAIGFRNFLTEQGFAEIRSPKIVFSGAEGGANIFKLDYFGKEAYLAQNPQFYKQIMVGVYERVFEIAPVFRAESHHTSRHINEYTSVDFEMGFIENFTEIMEMETKMIRETFEF